MAPAVWYRRGSFCRGSGRPDRPDFGAEPFAEAAAADTAEESSAKCGSGEASEASRVSQLSPEGDGGMPEDQRDEAGQMRSIKEESRFNMSMSCQLPVIARRAGVKVPIIFHG